MKSLVFFTFLMLLTACGVEKTRDSNGASDHEKAGARFEEAYDAWINGEAEKHRNYSYSFLQVDQKVTLTRVNIVNGKPTCRSKIEDSETLWTENESDINSHKGPKAVALDDIYQRCWELYQADKEHISFFYKEKLLAGCNRNCSEESCRDEDIPIFKFSLTEPLCDEKSF